MKRVAPKRPEIDGEQAYASPYDKVKISPCEGNADFGFQIFTELALDLELRCCQWLRKNKYFISYMFIYKTLSWSMSWKEPGYKWHKKKNSMNNLQGKISTWELIQKWKVCLEPQDRVDCWESLKQEWLVLATTVALKMQMVLRPPSPPPTHTSTCECKKLFLVILLDIFVNMQSAWWHFRGLGYGDGGHSGCWCLGA